MLRSISTRTLRFPFICSCFLALSACGQSTTSVSLHGVNYSGSAFRYFVMDLDNSQILGGGEMVEPFGAGGTMCCARLPKQWRPGIKLRVKTVSWLPKKSDGELPEIREVHTVEVPPYVDGKVGELWVVRAVDGTMGVVSSDYQPDHPKWPGKVKGWPKPSLEFRRERWAVLLAHEESYVRIYLSLLDQLEHDPRACAREAWKLSRQFAPQTIKKFSGPEDREYMIHLANEYAEGLEDSKRRVMGMMEAKP